MHRQCSSAAFWVYKYVCSLQHAGEVQGVYQCRLQLLPAQVTCTILYLNYNQPSSAAFMLSTTTRVCGRPGSVQVFVVQCKASGTASLAAGQPACTVGGVGLQALARGPHVPLADWVW